MKDRVLDGGIAEEAFWIWMGIMGLGWREECFFLHRHAESDIFFFFLDVLSYFGMNWPSRVSQEYTYEE